MNILITYSMQPLFSTVDLVAKKGQISNLATTAPHTFALFYSLVPGLKPGVIVGTPFQGKNKIYKAYNLAIRPGQSVEKLICRNAILIPVYNPERV